MKIAISSSGKDLNSDLDVRFGRSPYFVIYDTDSKEVKSVENKGQTSGHGAGVAAAQQILDEGIDVVITGNLGPNAYNLMKKSNIKSYGCSVVSCKNAIELFQEGKLSELTESGPSHMGL
jgi:predicted Fe-Mo cluster-binding NifX family protein